MSGTPRIAPSTERPATPAPVALLAGCVFCVVVGVQWPVLSVRSEMFDDAAYMTLNPLVKSGGWDSARRFVCEVVEPSTVRGYYQPLAMISLMLDCSMGGSPSNLVPFRATSLVMHGAISALVLVLFWDLFGDAAAATVGALAFGLHPACVESTAWLSDRKTLLAGFFCVASIVVYLRYVRSGGRAAYCVSLGCYLLALLSKPTATLVPLMMLALDFWPLGRLGGSGAGDVARKWAIGPPRAGAAFGGASRRNGTWRVIREKVPYLVLSLVFAVITYISQSRTGGVIAAEKYPIWGVALIVCYNLVFYPLKFFWPTPLSAHYPFPVPVNLSHPHVLGGLIGSGVLLVVLALSLLRTRSVVSGWLFFLFAILPAIGIVGFTPVIAADRYAYFAKLGFILPIVYWLSRPPGSAGSRAGRRWPAFACAAVLLAAEARLTRRYLAEWRETEGFARYLVAYAPGSSYLRTNLGKALTAAGREREAMEQFAEAVRLGDEPDAHAGLAVPLAAKGRLKEAENHLREAVRLDGNNPVTRNNLGLLLERTGRGEEAFPHIEKAAALRPGDATYALRLAECLAAKGRAGEAIRVLEQARALRAAAGDTAAVKELGDRIEALRAGRSAGRP